MVLAGIKILSTVLLPLAKDPWSVIQDRGPRRRLILFTRYPQPGRTKTRMIPALGAEGASDLQRRMTERALSEARRLVRWMAVSLEVRFEGGDEAKMSAWLGQDLTLCAQGGGDLGERMTRAFRAAFDAGMTRAVIMGSDCPDLACPILKEAFAALELTEMVLGPAGDGGYYLIGLTMEHPELFQGIPWGSEKVMAATLSVARERGVTVTLLGELWDVDRPEDLPIWERVARYATED